MMGAVEMISYSYTGDAVAVHAASAADPLTPIGY